MIKITQNLLRELFDYRDGNLYWKKSGKGRKMDIPAGNVNITGYRYVGIDGKLYRSHRLIFLYHHGFLPEFLDHIDGNKLNNFIDNLRNATKSQNNMNRKKYKSQNGKSTSSKYKGVFWDKYHKKWTAQISINGKHKYLGRYDSEIDAAKAYNQTAVELFGKFVRTNEVRC